MLKELTEGTFEEGEIPKKLLKLFNILHELRELVDFESESLKNVLCKMMPFEMLFFESYNSISKVA